MTHNFVRVTLYCCNLVTYLLFLKSEPIEANCVGLVYFCRNLLFFGNVVFYGLFVRSVLFLCDILAIKYAKSKQQIMTQ